MASHYYNEFNPQAAAMLRQMMIDGLIPFGDVDERSITEVEPDELKKYIQCHFFAGIGGWQYALQLAGWPDDVPVWTGSCPCQPFSAAGRQKGKADDRHLWPHWLRLIKECRPPVIFGEQVASAVAHGWLDDVYEGLEAEHYAVGSAVLPACSVGAPHKRDRLWFVADTNFSGLQTERTEQQTAGIAGDNARNAPVADTEKQQSTCHNAEFSETEQREYRGGCSDGGVRTMANTCGERLQGHGRPEQEYGAEGREVEKRHPWSSGVWVNCPDGKARLVEPDICLLVDGFQHRKPILHAFGNAIVPQVAAEFIKSYMDI